MTSSAERVLDRGAARSVKASLQTLTRPTAPKPPADATKRAQWYGKKNGLCTRICKNVHSTRLSGRRLFSFRRPPKQHILARMADKPGPRCGNGAPRAE